jgi:hypothetical protein
MTLLSAATPSLAAMLPQARKEITDRGVDRYDGDSAKRVASLFPASLLEAITQFTPS